MTPRPAYIPSAAGSRAGSRIEAAARHQRAAQNSDRSIGCYTDIRLLTVNPAWEMGQRLGVSTRPLEQRSIRSIMAPRWKIWIPRPGSRKKHLRPTESCPASKKPSSCILWVADRWRGPRDKGERRGIREWGAGNWNEVFSKKSDSRTRDTFRSMREQEKARDFVFPETKSAPAFRKRA